MDLDESTDRIKFLIRDRDILYPPQLEHITSCPMPGSPTYAAPCAHHG